MSIPGERKVYSVHVRRIVNTTVTLLVEAESEREAVEAVEAESIDRWEGTRDDEETEVDALPAFDQKAVLGVVDGIVYEAGSEDYDAAIVRDREHPVDRLTLPLFGAEWSPA